MKYTEIIDDKLDLLINQFQPLADLSIKEINSIVLNIRTKIRRFKWDHTGNIFNHLASQWLIQNLPVQMKISSFEQFVKSLAFYKPFNITPEIYELYLRNFYKAALSVWIQLKDPNLDEVQLAVLEIVAKAINMNMKLERETFAQALYDILLVLINRKNEIITEDNFVKLMRNYLGILWKEQPAYYKACGEYYEFAKHFILIDFPNKKHSYFKNFHAILQGKIAYFSDYILTFMEKFTQKVYKKIVKKKYFIDDDDLLEIDESPNEQKNCLDFQKYLSQLIIANSCFIRTKVLCTKLFLISELLAKEQWNFMKKYEIIRKFDFLLEKSRFYALCGKTINEIKILHCECILPSLEKANVYIIILKNTILMKFENFKNLDLKSLISTLKNKIEFLRESMLIFYEGLIEMKFNRFSLETIYNKIKTDIVTVYNEIHNVSEENHEGNSRSMILYQNAIKFFRRKGENNVKIKEKEKELRELEEIQEESKEIYKEEEN